jgi:hypothetical protein
MRWGPITVCTYCTWSTQVCRPQRKCPLFTVVPVIWPLSFAQPSGTVLLHTEDPPEVAKPPGCGYPRNGSREFEFSATRKQLANLRLGARSIHRSGSGLPEEEAALLYCILLGLPHHAWAVSARKKRSGFAAWYKRLYISYIHYLGTFPRYSTITQSLPLRFTAGRAACPLQQRPLPSPPPGLATS